MKLTGLNDNEILESRRKHGSNTLTPPPDTPIWRKFLACFNDPLIKVLLVAMALAIGIACYECYTQTPSISMFLEPLGIFIAVILATLIGFILELNANKKFNVLNQVNDDTQVAVLRGGSVTHVAKKDIVVGDIVFLRTGDEVPADGVLIDSTSLLVNESSLTGENSTEKTHLLQNDTVGEETYPANRVLRSSTVIDGTGIMKVDAVGDATEYGKVYHAAQIASTEPTPLTRQLEKLGKFISYVSYIIGILVLVGRMAMYDYADFNWLSFTNYSLTSLMLAVTLIVVSVPEGLPMSITLSLALSMRRMLKTNNLVRKLHACETMGAVTVICTDKTGTLTENVMKVAHSQIDKSCSDALLAEAVSVNSTAFIDGKTSEVLGNPTEGALLKYIIGRGFDYLSLRRDCRVVEQLPFSTLRKYMATVVDSKALNGRRVVYVKGAPEIVLEMCRQNLDDGTRARYEAQLTEYQDQAMRTIALAYAVVDSSDSLITADSLTPTPLTLMGFFAISDPVRHDVESAVALSQHAGISIKIVTGDTFRTARQVARRSGLWDDNVDSDANAVSGTTFAEMTDDEAAKIVDSIKIMYRARPTDKSRLVRLLQQNGHVVAATGDGTNDAPALHAAHVGLAMGDGTAVAKEAGDITILDNSFDSITRAVMWGRSLYRNIQRFILFQLTVNLVACLTVLIGAFTGQQSPLTVSQMLWVNLIMDTFAALSLASLPPSTDVMNNRPRRQTAFIVTRPMAITISLIGTLMAILLFGLAQYFKHTDAPLCEFSTADYLRCFFAGDLRHSFMSTYELTLFFTIFVFLQFWNLFNAKTFASRSSAFANVRSSKVFFATAAAILIGQILIVNFGGEMFGVEPISLTDWIITFLATSIVLVVGELYHILRRLRK